MSIYYNVGGEYNEPTLMVINVAAGMSESEMLIKVIDRVVVDPVQTMFVFKLVGLNPTTDPQLKELFKGRNLDANIYLAHEFVAGNYMTMFELALITFFEEKLNIKFLNSNEN